MHGVVLYYVIYAAPTNTHQSVTHLALYHASSNCPDLLSLYYPNPQSRWTWYARGPSRSSLRQSANARSRSTSLYGKCIVADYNAVHKDKCVKEFLKLKDCYLAAARKTN
ncbi:Putative NADH dehydrogenase [ubiquinone] 1 alpha subcomplex assembly factor 8 [Colletotrichum destructivum]|uniref:NADH dehydrogenase [ubiquinone] 1 alpha subcomplex assembly factor 8 n=1 Tax=Colletotrichum destructivum TaxID=34406 RepID=A0AAX4IEE7_9PEZI|nr:Putative NADH dehydrogenase [ubiquinone] 1 alpha subcomplex assembly factor 8 [Colletotrichum destructivum]